ncbi:MAG: glycosyltransferase [Selenomonadaceae bacterium]|nr:glycosyltransferase [Selenomonadaceae bacterium]
MNERKFEIIIHATGAATCNRLINSLQKVIVPENFTAEIQLVEGAEKYFAYDTAMRASDAKYKIYLDERATIVNENFLLELLKIFNADKKIGAVGTSGAIKLSTHGVALNSAKRAPKNFYDYAEIADGFFFATQYDLPWRHDLFKDNFFGGQAQCVEFKRAGYKIFIGGDWISLDDKNFALDVDARNIFLDEYSKDLFPLVSVIIPTFNRPKYFKEALDSALNQTYRNIEIFISDNSTDDATERLITTYDDARIKYFHHKNFDAHDNWNFARDYNNPAAEFVNWLMVDDIFYPPKLEKMVEVYRNNPDVSLVTSKRHLIDADGKVTSETRTPFESSVKIDGEKAGKIFFSNFENYIGEPTTVLIRKKFLRNGDLCWHDDERGFFNLVDVSTWCQLLSQGNLFFFNEILSCYRAHNETASVWKYTAPLVAIQLAKLIKSAWERKIFLKTQKDVYDSIISWFKGPGLSGFLASVTRNYYGAEFETLKKYFVTMAQALSNGYKIELPPVEYSEQDAIKKIR